MNLSKKSKATEFSNSDMRVIAKQKDFQHPQSLTYKFSVFALTCMDSPDCHQVKLSSLSLLARSSCVISVLVCVSLNAPMSHCPCRVAYGESSQSLFLRITNQLLQIAILTFRKHLIEGFISILISGQFITWSNTFYNNHCQQKIHKKSYY